MNKENAGIFFGLESLLLELKKLKDEAIKQDKNCLPKSVINEYKKKFIELIYLGLARIKKPNRKVLKLGKIPEGPERSLLLRLKKLINEVFRFAENFNVWFTNNESERSLRGSKVRQSVSKCFRTLEGLKIHASISSILDTAVKNGIKKSEMIKAVFDETAEDKLRAVLV